MWIAADAPNIADWISAIGQALGALGTFAAVFYAIRLGARDRRWRLTDQALTDAERRDAEAAQARTITTTVKSRSSMYEPDPSQRETWVEVGNNGTLPVLNVELVAVTASKYPTHTFRQDVSETADEARSGDVLAAGETVDLEFWFDREDGADVGSVWGWKSVTIGFTDAYGLRWTRRDNEAPVRVLT